MHTVKPLDTAALRDAFRTCRLVATCEEHSPIGGLGAAVAEWMVDAGVPAPASGFLRFHTGDAFYRLSGEQEYAREQLGLSAGHMTERIARALQTQEAV